MSPRYRSPAQAPGTGKTKKHGERERPYRGAGRWLFSICAFLLLGSAAIIAVSSTRGNRRAGPPLNAQGLRVSGAGRADATQVFPATQFSDPRAQRAYRIAAEIPQTLNQLYCWCGCIERGMRSNLECFESRHAASCDICLAGAEVAFDMRQKGVTDPAEVQRRLDARFARPPPGRGS